MAILWFRPFWYISYHLFLIPSASIRPLLFLSFTVTALHGMFPWCLQLSRRALQSFPLSFSPLLLCTVDSRRASFLLLLFPGILHSDDYVFPSLLCLSFLFFSQLFPRPPQTAALPAPLLSLWAGFGHCLRYRVTHFCPQFFGPSDLIPWIYSPPSLYSPMEFDLGSTWMA